MTTCYECGGLVDEHGCPSDQGDPSCVECGGTASWCQECGGTHRPEPDEDFTLCPECGGRLRA